MFDHLTTALVHVANHQSTAKPPSSRRRDGDEKQQKKIQRADFYTLFNSILIFRSLTQPQRAQRARNVHSKRELCVAVH